MATEKTEKKYDGSSIQDLTPLEHLRLNPAMYIGDSDTPTHLLYEILAQFRFIGI